MKRLKGFTLIEMIITIVVIIILSSISVPMYKGYKRQAIAAEGYVLLSAIRNAQKVYYHRYRNFLHYINSSSYLGGSPYTNNEEVLGIDARGNKYFTWFCVRVGDGYNDRYFAIAANKPRELRKADGDGYLVLQFNISLGEKIVDWIDYDESWKVA